MSFMREKYRLVGILVWCTPGPASWVNLQDNTGSVQSRGFFLFLLSSHVCFAFAFALLRVYFAFFSVSRHRTKVG